MCKRKRETKSFGAHRQHEDTRHLMSKKDLRSIMGAIEELSTELVSGLLPNGRNLPDAPRSPKPSTRALLISRRHQGVSSGMKVIQSTGNEFGRRP